MELSGSERLASGFEIDGFPSGVAIALGRNDQDAVRPKLHCRRKSGRFAAMTTPEHMGFCPTRVRPRIGSARAYALQRNPLGASGLAGRPSGGSSRLWALGTARANTGTASAFVALLAELWAPTSMILFEILIGQCRMGR